MESVLLVCFMVPPVYFFSKWMLLGQLCHLKFGDLGAAWNRQTCL